MLHRRNPILAVLLAMWLALAVALPSALALPRVDASGCEDCCAASSGQSGCAAVSVCAPASPDAGVDETSLKPQGAWAAGVVRCAGPPTEPSATWAYVPAGRSAGPPSYLRFGRFLL
jgi:hypothetical protein